MEAEEGNNNHCLTLHLDVHWSWVITPATAEEKLEEGDEGGEGEGKGKRGRRREGGEGEEGKRGRKEKGEGEEEGNDEEEGEEVAEESWQTPESTRRGWGARQSLYQLPKEKEIRQGGGLDGRGWG
jgi:hypothetical protein